MDWVAKDKKTNEVVSIVTHSCGTTSSYTYVGKDGICRTMEENAFKRKYEMGIDVDLSHLAPVIIQAAKIPGEIQDLLAVLARKCTPDYYAAGSKVFLWRIDNDAAQYFGELVSQRSYYYGGPIIFDVVGVEEDAYEPGLKFLALNYFKGEKTTKPDYPDLRIPIQTIRPFAKDATKYLKRVDMPF